MTRDETLRKIGELFQSKQNVTYMSVEQIIQEVFDNHIEETEDILYNTFKDRSPDDIAREIFLLVHGDNDLFALTLAFYKHMDSTYKEQFRELILED